MPAFKLTAPTRNVAREPKKEEKIVTQYNVVGGISRAPPAVQEIPVSSIMPSPTLQDKLEEEKVVAVAKEEQLQTSVVVEEKVDQPEFTAEECPTPSTTDQPTLDRVDCQTTEEPVADAKTIDETLDISNVLPEESVQKSQVAHELATQIEQTTANLYERELILLDNINELDTTTPPPTDLTVVDKEKEANDTAPAVCFESESELEPVFKPVFESQNQNPSQEQALVVDEKEAPICAAPKKVQLVWPPPPQEDDIKDLAQNAETAEKLIESWLEVAERRVNSGIIVWHLVNYFEEAIVQQFQ